MVLPGFLYTCFWASGYPVEARHQLIGHWGHLWQFGCLTEELRVFVGEQPAKQLAKTHEARRWMGGRWSRSRRWTVRLVRCFFCCVLSGERKGKYRKFPSGGVESYAKCGAREVVAHVDERFLVSEKKLLESKLKPEFRCSQVFLLEAHFVDRASVTRFEDMNLNFFGKVR